MISGANPACRAKSDTPAATAAMGT